MYQYKDKVYSDAGKVLIGGGRIGFQFIGTPEDFREEEIDIENLAIDGGYVSYHHGKLRHRHSSRGYAYWKSHIIKLRYSNDDQIAIMLNGEKEAILRMNAWREWASTLAKAITNKEQ